MVKRDNLSPEEMEELRLFSKAGNALLKLRQRKPGLRNQINETLASLSDLENHWFAYIGVDNVAFHTRIVEEKFTKIETKKGK